MTMDYYKTDLCLKTTPPPTYHHASAEFLRKVAESVCDWMSSQIFGDWELHAHHEPQY